MLERGKALLCVLAATVLLVLGCQPVTDTGGGGQVAIHTLSGKMVDGFTGTPIAGGVVEFAGLSAKSGADGTYSLDFGKSSGTLGGTFAIRATGYVSYLFEGATADAGSDVTVNLVLQRIDLSGAAYHDVTLHIFELQTDPSTPTEIPDGTPVFVAFYNENGAGSRSSQNYNGGYSWHGAIGGDSCVVAVYVDLAAVSSMHSFTAIKENVSVTDPSQELSLNEDPGSEVPMSINGDAGLNGATLYLSFPNGIFPVLNLALDSGAQAALQFSNPNGYEGLWLQSAGNTMACSTVGPVSASVTLPNIPTLDPLFPPDAGTLAYDSGTLSVGSVAGAGGYSFWLMDGSSNLLAAVGATGPSVTLPAWMQAQFAGSTVKVMPVSSSTTATSSDVSLVPISFITGGATPSAVSRFVMGASTDLNF